MAWIAEEREEVCRRWMAAAQHGDGEAYESLLREILPLLRRFVRGRVGGDPAMEDVVQNVLLAVHRARHTYRPERPFSPWLRAVARNAVTDHLRRRVRRQRRELPLEAPERLVAEPARDPEPPLSPELRAALERLPPAQREAVELIQLQGLSVVEAAARAGVRPGALKVRAHRGYRALRSLLGDEEER